MKFIYIANARIPTEKAHGYQICKMCEEFSNAGVEVELWIPTRKNSIKEDAFEFYNIKKKFRIKKVKCFDFIPYDKFLFHKAIYLQSLLFFIKLLFKKVDRDSIIYTRSPEIVWLFSSRNFATVFESHNLPKSKIWLYKFFLKGVFRIVCNSRGTAEGMRKIGFSNTLVAPNGVDLDKFYIEDSKTNLRKELHLPVDKKIVMYAGHLYSWKGIDNILEAAKTLIGQDDILFILVGGTTSDQEKYEQLIKVQKLSNVKLYGHKKHEEIPRYLKCADVLLLPNSPASKESELYTSPIKMFEYMASGTPIVASDLPSIREVLSKDNAVFVNPDSPGGFAGGIRMVLENSELAVRISKQARLDAQRYTWRERSEKIIKFINT